MLSNSSCRRAHRLALHCLAAGFPIYDPSAAAFVSRVHRDWKAWRSASGALLELEPSLPPLKRIDVDIALRQQGHIDLIQIPACVVRKADRGVGVEWCEPLPVAVDELVSYAADVMMPPYGIADYLSRLKPTG
jgi:hypothetical protein